MGSAHVTGGLDNIACVEKKLRGKRIGLMTNPSAVNRELFSAVDILHETYGLTALYACEHGLRGTEQAGAEVMGYVDPETGVRVFRAYGGDNHIEPGGLDGIDVFVYDMQQVGVRFYTRLYALAYAMMDCAARGIPVVVLDRLNPIGGEKIAGTILDTAFRSFVGDFGLPSRIGITVGEYAHFVNDHCGLGLDLTVSPVRGWRRAQYFDDTDLPWVETSPNIPTLSSALCYVGTCLFEGTNVSEGRGTTLPFEVIGAPWIDDRALFGELRALGLPGVAFRRVSFTPTFQKHAGAQCNGVQLHVLDREAADPFEAGLMLCDTIKAMYPNDFRWLPGKKDGSFSADRLLGTDAYTSGQMTARELLKVHKPGLDAFAAQKARYHLYA